MYNLLQDFLAQIQQSDRHVAFLLWYFSNNNSSAVPIKQPDDFSNNYQALKKYSPRLNPKQHTRQQPAHNTIFLIHSDDLTHLQKDMSFWFKNGGHKLYKNPLQCEKKMELAFL